MNRYLKSPLIALLLVAPALLAQAPRTAPMSEPVKCSAAELDRQVFRVGDLELKIRDFKPNRGFGTRLIAFQLENLGSGFLAFAAEDMMLVSAGGSQVLETAPQEDFRIQHLPQRLRIAPGAHVTLTLYPDQTVKFPAKLYLGERLLAEITE